MAERPSQTPARSGAGTGITAMIVTVLVAALGGFGVELDAGTNIALIGIAGTLLGAAATWARNQIKVSDELGQPQSLGHQILAMLG